MGFSISWLAVKTVEHETLFDVAGVKPTDEEDEVFEMPLSGVALEGGWFLFVAQGCAHLIVSPGFLSDLSRRWECVACSVEEHVMCSTASCWKDGREWWSVSHDAQEGILNLDVTGDPPAVYREIREPLLGKQEMEGGEEADVDYVFDVPLELARQLTGFKHDEEPQCLDQACPIVFQGRRSPLPKIRTIPPPTKWPRGEA